MNQVVYDFEFIEDYSVPAPPTQSTGQDLQLNTADDAVWDPWEYCALQHTLALMVAYHYMYVYMYIHCMCI